MIACVLASADIAIDVCADQARCQRWTQQEVINPKTGIALERMNLGRLRVASKGVDRAAISRAPKGSASVNGATPRIETQMTSLRP